MFRFSETFSDGWRRASFGRKLVPMAAFVCTWFCLYFGVFFFTPG